MIAELLFLFCFGLLIYAWGVYPLVVLWLGQRGCRREPAGPGPDQPLARVAVLFAAHNEAEHMVARLENLCRVDYPSDRMTIRVGIDAGDERTAELAAVFAAREPRVQVSVFRERRGKVAVLKDLVRELDQSPGSPADVLVFTDANTMFDAQAVMRLVARLGQADVSPALSVGGVCGRLVLTDGDAVDAANGVSAEGSYWRLETRLKAAESALDSCLGANGAIYALRAPLFWRDIPDNTVIDDFVLGMKVREQGYRMVYEPAALAYEPLPAARAEWGRRVRIGAGDFQAVALCRRCLMPGYGRFAWMFGSHKVLRWLTPHLVLVAALSAPATVASGGLPGIAALIFLAGLGGILLGGGLADMANERAPLARVPGACRHFVSMNAALFVGSLRFCRGNLTGYWQRTER